MEPRWKFQRDILSPAKARDAQGRFQCSGQRELRPSVVPRTVIPDLQGYRFGSRVVIERHAKKHHWLCRCDCGAYAIIEGSRILKGGRGRCRRCFEASVRRETYTCPRLTGAMLRDEGVIEVGSIDDTNVVFVKTHARLCLFFADQIASMIPKLTPWALQHAKELLELGHGTGETGRRFGINANKKSELLQQLSAAGI